MDPFGESRGRRVVRRVGLVGGPLLALVAWRLLPHELVDASGAVAAFTPAGRATLALMAWMAAWWMTEAIDVEATALLPLVFLPLAGVSDMTAAAAPYASPLIWLFLGGFLMALAMQRHGLDRRIALLVLRLVGGRPANVVGGFMLATALMSACVSNSATVAMMLPIALGVGRLLRGEAEAGEPAATPTALETSLLLAIAYAASIGGLATLIGSPPNGFLAQYARTELGIEVSFLDWLFVGVPVTAVMLPLTWWLLTRVLLPLPRAELPGARELVAREIAGLGPVKPGEWVTFGVFLAAVAGWVGRPLLVRVAPELSDSVVAIAAGLALFVLPGGRDASGRAVRVLDWPATRGLPWGVLVLFGGGLSLAAAVGEHGVAEFLGGQVRALAGTPPLVLAVLVTALVIFLTELTSNTATAATLVPLLAALAPGLGVAPAELVLPATLAASCAFMLPVATPPNAIVFGSGLVPMATMCRVGVWLNLASIAVITAVLQGLVLRLLPGG